MLAIVPRLAFAIELDMSFDAGERADGDIHAIAQQTDGRIILAGEFTTINNVSRPHVARLHPDGALDFSFNTGLGPSSSVFAAVVQPDGKIVIGGAFGMVDGQVRPYLARLRSDGSLDADFNTNSIFNGVVRALALQTDGRIVVGGEFTDVGGRSRGRIARLLANGSLDETFDPGTGANGTLRALVLQPDGKVIIGGRFTSYDGVERARVARVLTSGALDADFDPGTGAERQVRALGLLPDGRIYVGGEFEIFNGANRSSIARLFPNGGLDPGFDPGVMESDEVQTLAVEPDGHVWIGGMFQQAGGQQGPLFARLNPSGAADPDVTSALNENLPGDEIHTVLRQGDGLMIVAGEFRRVNSFTRQRLARLIPLETPPLFRLGLPRGIPGNVIEGSQLVFSVDRIGPADLQARVDFATREGTAKAGVDFISLAETLTFAPGEIRKEITVSLLPDLVFDPAETFSISLSNPVGAQLGIPSTGTVEIVEASPVIQFTSRSYSNAEAPHVQTTDNQTIWIWLRRENVMHFPNLAARVEYEIDSGTAVHGQDFMGALRGVVDFPAGVHDAFISLTLVNDGLPEPAEAFSVRLLSVTGAVLNSNNVATVTILDDDGPVTWAASRTAVSESRATVAVEIRRNDNGPDPITVEYQVSSGSANAGEDFIASTGSVTFEPLERARTVTIQLLDDCRIEPDETAILTLRSVEGGAALGDERSASLVLLDNERAGTFDPDFSLGDKLGSQPNYPLAIDKEGRVLMAGTGRIVRLLPDWREDSGFVATSSNFLPLVNLFFAQSVRVEQMRFPSDGGVLIACRRDFFGPDVQVASNHVVRLKGDGALDESFRVDSRVVLPPGIWLFGGNMLIETQSDGKILVTGHALDSSGASISSGLVRLLSDGSLDESFHAGLAVSLSWEFPQIADLKVMSDGRIVLSGRFLLGGTNFSGVVRLTQTGSFDSTFVPVACQYRASNGVFFDSVPASLAVQVDGRIVIGGGFARAGGLLRLGLARLLADGAVDPEFDPGAGVNADMDVVVYRVLLDELQRIIVTGPLAGALAGPNQKMIRLLSNGTRDPQFSMNEETSIYSLLDVILLPDHNLLTSWAYDGLRLVNGDSAPKVSVSRMPGGGLILLTPAITGDRYTLERSSDFKTWESLETKLSTECSVEFLVPSSVPPNFYRLLRQSGP